MIGPLSEQNGKGAEPVSSSSRLLARPSKAFLHSVAWRCETVPRHADDRYLQALERTSAGVQPLE